MKIAEVDFKTIFDALPGAFLVVDPAYRIVAASDAYLRLTLLLREEITGKFLFEVFPLPLQDTSENWTALLKKSLEAVLLHKAEQTIEVQQYNMLRPAGTFEQHSRRILNKPVFNADQEVIFIIHRVEDGTELEYLEKERSASENKNEDLEKRASDLQASNTELERFAYVASHDLQEPLRMVSSFLLLLKKRYGGELDETADQYIHFATDGAERMKKLIHDLLEYSRVGVNTDDFTTIDLNQLLSYITIPFKDHFLADGAELKIGALPAIDGRKAQFIQLFQNLLSNAIKYKSREALKIEIGCVERTDHYEFFIRDNGLGIDEKFHEKIFVVFQRLHNRLEYAGTGIGLSICKKIVEGHGGKIWVESSQGKGSTFRFTIPYKR
ncbi:hypothetical protein BH11BAC7_BH11BAC7_06620 [soil metagenome]